MAGFLELQNAANLLDKLRHDMKLLEESPLDTYRAFNFFVTAEHLADWQFPGRVNDRNRKQLRRNSILLQICSHLANGMKHFHAEAKHHDTVSGATKNEGVFGSVYGNLFGAVFGREITIELDGDAKEQFGEKINAVELANKVLLFWEQQIEGQ
ncbi:hypothetical protein FYK55_07100 [Roseiconus nitratireducens]|uniref:Uncharacterized protein n=1 Tax=Roseiconus nitratireducens TaxID=2605748 RepID=A0A5M6DCX0_9BACT|nr:hypothetical protein [Roseiconus nitratireducens]KAA5545411.1 hypothetical protein FYK55_07100 [Roseiconus nitratireducens]